MAEGAATSEDILLLGVGQQSTQRHAQVVTSFRRLTLLQPGVSAYWNNLGAVCRQAGDLPAAEQALILTSMLSTQDNLGASLRTLAKARLPPGPGLAPCDCI